MDKFTALAGSGTTILSTELNSITSNAVSSAGATVSNDASGERKPLAMLEVYIAAQGSNRAAGAAIDILFVPTIDTTNFGDVTGDCADNYVVASVALDGGATAARRITIADVPLPPSDFKPYARNRTGQTLASSGNTVKIDPYSREDV